MLKYFKNISKNVIICYVISIFTLLIMFILSYAILYNVTPQALIMANRILIIAAFAYDMGRKKYYKKHKLYNYNQGGTIK